MILSGGKKVCLCVCVWGGVSVCPYFIRVYVTLNSVLDVLDDTVR